MSKANNDYGTWSFKCRNAKNGVLYFNNVVIECPACKCFHYADRLVMPSTKQVMEWTANMPVEKLIETISKY